MPTLAHWCLHMLRESMPSIRITHIQHSLWINAVHQGHKYPDSVTPKENTKAQCGFPFSSLLFSAVKTPLFINAIKQTLNVWWISGSGAVEMHLTSAFHKFLKSGEKKTNEIIQSNSSHLGCAGSPSLNCREAYAMESSFESGVSHRKENLCWVERPKHTFF